MTDSAAIWYKLKPDANPAENYMPNPVSTLVSLKGEDASRIYTMFRKEGALNFKIFNCESCTFEQSKTVDISELGVTRVDFAIQKVVYANERLILVKQTFQCDQKALIMYEIKLNKAFAIKTKLVMDLLNNAIDARQDGLYLFGGHDHALLPHARVVFYSFSMLRFDEIVAKEGPAPEPRFCSFSKLAGNSLIVTGGYATYSSYYKEQQLKDIWVFDLKCGKWSQTIQPNSFPASVSLVTSRASDIVFLCNNKRTSLSVYSSAKREFTHVKTSAAIEIEKGVW